jgi:hypothetical protein
MQDDAASVPEEKLVVISSEDEHNGDTYVRTSDGFTFLISLSGVQGIKGETGL